MSTRRSLVLGLLAAGLLLAQDPQPTVQVTLASQFTIGNSARNPVRGPGLQKADSSAFGTVIGAGNPRDFEFALKVRY